MSRVILGMGFGDEGKGKVVDYFADSSSTVVRFNGGPQAGHTVSADGKTHVFSHFGSGTLKGARTLWSHFCTCDPIAFTREREVLRELGVRPSIMIDELSPVTTPFDIFFNRMDAVNGHGSCGMGFGSTLQREEDHYHLRYMDLFTPTVMMTKLESIRKYYEHRLGKKLEGRQIDMLLEAFLDSVVKMTGEAEAGDVRKEIRGTEDSELIFEGAQGVMLDQEFGFFPHVTRSYTTSRNANDLHRVEEIVMVSRVYQTRHGNGPMSSEGYPINLSNNQGETNVENPYQGAFRTGRLDLDILTYAIKCQMRVFAPENLRLVFTCIDQIEDPEKIPMTHQGLKVEYGLLEAVTVLEESGGCDFTDVYECNGPEREQIVCIR